jgi:hypothetical protein
MFQGSSLTCVLLSCMDSWCYSALLGMEMSLLVARDIFRYFGVAHGLACLVLDGFAPGC